MKTIRTSSKLSLVFIAPQSPSVLIDTVIGQKLIVRKLMKNVKSEKKKNADHPVKPKRTHGGSKSDDSQRSNPSRIKPVDNGAYRDAVSQIFQRFLRRRASGIGSVHSRALGRRADRAFSHALGVGTHCGRV